MNTTHFLFPKFNKFAKVDFLTGNQRMKCYFKVGNNSKIWGNGNGKKTNAKGGLLDFQAQKDATSKMKIDELGKQFVDSLEKLVSKGVLQEGRKTNIVDALSSIDGQNGNELMGTKDIFSTFRKQENLLDIKANLNGSTDRFCEKLDELEAKLNSKLGIASTETSIAELVKTLQPETEKQQTKTEVQTETVTETQPKSRIMRNKLATVALASLLIAGGYTGYKYYQNNKTPEAVQSFDFTKLTITQEQWDGLSNETQLKLAGIDLSTDKGKYDACAILKLNFSNFKITALVPDGSVHGSLLLGKNDRLVGAGLHITDDEIYQFNEIPTDNEARKLAIEFAGTVAEDDSIPSQDNKDKLEKLAINFAYTFYQAQTDSTKLSSLKNKSDLFQSSATNLIGNSAKVKNILKKFLYLVTKLITPQEPKLDYSTEYESFISESDWKLLSFEQKKRVLSGQNIDWTKAVSDYVKETYKNTQNMKNAMESTENK